MRLRPSTDLLPQSGSLENLKYIAAVDAEGVLRMRVYPSRAHKVFLRFSNFILEQNLSPEALAELSGAALL